MDPAAEPQPEAAAPEKEKSGENPEGGGGEPPKSQDNPEAPAEGQESQANPEGGEPVRKSSSRRKSQANPEGGEATRKSSSRRKSESRRKSQSAEGDTQPDPETLRKSQRKSVKIAAAAADHEEEEEEHQEEGTHEMGTDAGTDAPVEGEGDANFAPLDGFCRAQIQIPFDLPHILKQFTKAAIRTQPRDLDIWGAAYFRAMADGLPPPVKETLEYPVMESKDGLTVGLLRVLDRQLKNSTITIENVREKWCSLCLERKAFNELIEIGHFTEGELIDWKKILAVLCTSLGTNLTDTMRVICQVLTEQKEGGDPVIPYVVWWELYLFLARLDGTIPSKQLQMVNEFLVRRAHAKFCLIGPSDFLHVDCPPLY